MSKKSSPDNMSEFVREQLTADPSMSANDVKAALMAIYPSHRFNANSFSVAFYTGRKKLGIKSGRKVRGKSQRKPIKAHRQGSVWPRHNRQAINLQSLNAAAKFVSDVGGFDAAFESVKQVQTVQIH